MFSYLCSGFLGIIQALYSLRILSISECRPTYANKTELYCSIIKTNNSATVIGCGIINKDKKVSYSNPLFNLKAFFSLYFFNILYEKFGEAR